MKVTENMKFIKIGTLFEDDAGYYYIVIDYDKQFNCYICILCNNLVMSMLNKNGIDAFEDVVAGKNDTFDDFLYTFEMEDLVFIGADIIKQY